MRWFRRIGLGVVGAAIVWIVALAVIGRLYAGCQKEKTEHHLADRMAAAVTIGDLDLGLVVGAVSVEQLHIARADGKLVLDVAHVDLDVPPLGGALFDRKLGAVRVRGVDGTLAPGGLEMHGPKARPLHVGSLDLDDATLHLALPVPVTVHVAHASAGATTLATALSWVFSLRTLDGTVEVLGGLRFGLRWQGGVAHVTLPGGHTIDVPLAIPPVDPGNEKAQLYTLGRTLLDGILQPR